MTSDKTYAINSLRAISENLDGETIIINLESGSYYSMNETGSLVWEYIQSGHSVSQIVALLGRQYESSPEVIERAVLDLILMLERNQLIIEAEPSEVRLSEDANVAKKPYVAPVIEKYEDMQEMLLADPIHDVDTAGWPKRKEDNKEDN